MKKRISAKVLAFVLCLAMLLPMATMLPFTAAAASGSGSSEYSSATSTETIVVDGVYYHIQKSVTYAGNSTYSLNIRIHTSLSESEAPLFRTSAENGYFTVQTTGYYLLELWGGKGAAGSGTASTPAGNGGAAGYVYAKVWLEKGQTLAYSIGTNGSLSSAADDGGGENGTGGGHGSTGRYGVGGGGGYSALYFFDEGEFDPAWLTSDNVWQMPESARVANYVMIAAGGGGGGASAAEPEDYATDALGNLKTADGGAGGSISNGASATLSGDDCSVEGYLFKGQDGKSNGTGSARVGKGGTEKPGAGATTVTGAYAPTVKANDWTGASTSTSAPGAGGSGNLRGGGGGAGYCGGGGGNMQGLLLPYNVGGGGGGSSFLASAFGESEVAFGNGLTAEIRKLLKGSGGLSDISDEGGAFCYTYIGDGSGEAVMDTSYLSSVVIEGRLSKYFTPTTYYTSDGTVGSMGELTENGSITYDTETGEFKVVGANINTATLTNKGVALSITFMIVPKAGFAGGNNVPLLESVKATVTRDADDVFEVSATYQADTDNVNVPLQLKIRTNSMVHSLATGESSVKLLGADLYEADYATAIAAFSSTSDSNEPTWEYDFISKIADYRIYKGKNATSGTRYYNTTTLTVTETTYYTVSMVVTVKTGTYATVGPAMTTDSNTVMGVATITLIGGNVFDTGWSYMLTAKKSLTYSDGTYIFGQVTTQTLEREYQQGSYYTYSGTESTYTQTFTASASGYYLVQAWGATGGDGGEAHVSAQTHGYNEDGSDKYGPMITRDATGGTGSSGATQYGFVYLQAGDQLTVTTGKTGADGTSVTRGVKAGEAYNRSYFANGTGGSGGGYAAISITRNGETQYLLIAGGGGGGGGGGACCNCGTISMSNIFGGDTGRNQHHGQNGFTTAATIRTEFGDISYYSGKNGNSGNAYIPSGQASQDWSGSSALGGAKGAVYINNEILNVGNTETETIHMNSLAEAMIKQGGVQTSSGTENAAAQITYICTSETTDLLNAFPGVVSTGAFTKYFDVVENAEGYTVDMVIDGRDYDQRVVEESDNIITVTYYQAEELVASFSYELTENDDGTTSYEILSTVYHPEFVVVKGAATPTYQATCEFTFAFSLKPAEGFIGGNDIPVLAAPITISKGANVGELAENPVTDYANVEINYDLDSLFAVKDGYVVLGDADTANDSIDITSLYTLGEFTVPDGEDAWKYDFVELVAPAAATYKPTATTNYKITAKIVPKAAATKAAISSNSEGLAVTKQATVYVKYPVVYNLSHMETTGEALADSATEFRIKLTPEEGYTAPPAYDAETGVRYISLSVGSYDRNSNFTYDEATGEFVIPASYVTGAILITASAKKELYKVTYIAYQYGAVEDTPYHTREEWLLADTPLDYEWMSDFAMPVVPGYTFTWEWGTDDGTQPTNMPAYNLLVVGRYVANRHGLTIYYQNSAGDTLAPTYEIELPYGSTFNVLSPTVEGYMANTSTYGADAFAISGTMGDSDITVTVTYIYANNRLVILYIDRNGNELATRYDVTLTEGASYEVDSPALVGYTVREGFETVSGTLTCTESLTVRVYYDPVRYTINFEYRYEGNSYQGPIPEGTTLDFDFSGATMDATPFEVEFNNLYVYNAVTGDYGLPTPLALGYVFAGWYTDTTYQTEITEDSIVSLPPHTTLYAKWLPTKYIVTIRYDFVRDGDFEPDISLLPEGTLYNAEGGYYYYRLELEVGTDYSVSVSSMTGYTAYLKYGTADQQVAPAVIAGNMPAMAVLHQVTYVIHIYTVQFVDKPGENISLPDGFADELPVFEAVWQDSTVHHGEAPVYTGSKPSYVYDATVNNSLTYQHYAFVFVGWKHAETGTVYASGTQLPPVTADVVYYACYEARENVAVLETYQGAVVAYYPSLQSALDAAIAHTNASNSSRRPVVKLFRPVTGTASVIDLTVTEEIPTLTASAASVRYITLDLNGYTLTTNATFLINGINLLLIDGVGGGAINVTGTDDVVGIVNTSYPLQIGQNSTATPKGVTVNVVSTNGSATGIDIQSSVAYLYACDISARAEGTGNAYGLTNASTVYHYGTLSATAADGNAYAAYVEYTLYLYGSAALTATTAGTGAAYGAYCRYVPNFNGTAVTVTATANGTGAAYGLRFDSTSTSSYSVSGTNITVSAIAAGNDAYGICFTTTPASVDGALYFNGTGITVNATAGGTGVAYGTRANYHYLAAEDLVINAQADAAAYGIYTDVIQCRSYAVGVTASSTAANATAVLITSKLYSTSYNTLLFNATANAPNGIAVGISSNITDAHTVGTSLIPCTVSASGKNATAVEAAGVTAVLTVYGMLSATATTGQAMGIALNGYELTVSDGASITASATGDGGNAYAVCRAKLNFAATTTAATVSATSTTGMAVLLYNSSTLSTFSTAAMLTVTTESGAACVIYIVGAGSHTLSSSFALTATATAEGGCAYGALVKGGTLTLGGQLTVEGPTAFGVRVEQSGSFTPQATAVLTVTATADRACGIDLQSGSMSGAVAFSMSVTAPSEAYGLYSNGTVAAFYANASVTATGADGVAYGVYTGGNFLTLAAVLTVNATKNAYGACIAGGYIDTTTSAFRATVTSTEADAYGVYATGGRMGNAGLSSSIRYGVITVTANAGTSYGLYASGAKLYVRGEQLYYKAEVPSTGITICEGYSEVQRTAGAATYPLYHYLTALSYTITFVTNGGDAVSSMTLPVDSYVALPSATRTGAIFAGWYLDAALLNEATLTAMPNYDLTLYAGWQVTITFVDVSGNVSVDPVTGFIGASVTVDDPSRNGYDFGGWHLDEALTQAYALEYFPESHLTLYIKWVARDITITFVTNGGSVMESLTGQVGDAVSVENPLRPGYIFGGWYLDEALQSYYGSSVDSFPEGDVTLYAQWYVYASLILLGEYNAYTVRLNFGDFDADGVIGEGEYQEYVFGADGFYMDSVADWWIFSVVPMEYAEMLGLSELVRFKGWFTAPMGGTAVNLASGIGSWGVEPVDGVINLYPQVEFFDKAVTVTDLCIESDGDVTLDFEGDGVAETYLFTKMDTLVPAVNGDTGGYQYYTYKSFRRGTHKIVLASSMGAAHLTLVKHGLDGTVVDTVYDGLMPSMQSIGALSELLFEVEMEEGEVLEYRVHYADAEGTENEEIILWATFPGLEEYMALGEEFLLGDLFAIHNALDHVIYSVTMGTVQLPLNGTPGFDGVTGWKYMDNGDLGAEILTSIKPALLENVDIWQDMGGIALLQLYPYSADALLGWLASIQAGRHFNPSVLLDADQALSAAIRQNGGLTFAFIWEGLMTDGTLPYTYTETTLCFSAGLPAGTTLTVIDLSGLFEVEGDEFPLIGYYSFVVGENDAGITEIDLSRFIAAGGGGAFAGFSPLMMLNLSFAGAQSAPTGGTIGMKLDGKRVAAELDYTVTPVIEQSLTVPSLQTHDDTFGGNFYLPEMAGQGYADDDTVVLLLRLKQDGKYVPLPATLQLSGEGIVQYSDFAAAVVGTASELAAGGVYQGGLTASALRYHGLGFTLCYEVVVVPADTDLSALSCLGAETAVHARYTIDLVIEGDAPEVSLVENKETHEASKGSAKQGESLTLRATASDQSSSEFSLYVYQTVDGKMQYTRECATLLAGVSVDQYGHATLDDGSMLTCGTEFTLTLRATAEDGSPGAAPGVYFLVAYLGDNYAVYTLTVTE